VVKRKPEHDVLGAVTGAGRLGLRAAGAGIAIEAVDATLGVDAAWLVECGYERMDKVQEDIRWACEAAHMPVVWATQMLETLAKTGMPSRAEITDAAMGERAECVMPNKGPHIVDAMRKLADILRRMQAHQSKERPVLHALKSWAQGIEAAAPAQAMSSPARSSARATPASQFTGG
jgi:hypothetical protein